MNDVKQFYNGATVKDIIDALSKYNPDGEVWIDTGSNLSSIVNAVWPLARDGVLLSHDDLDQRLAPE